MSRPDQAECRGVLLRATENAILVAKSNEDAETFWVPRSQIGYMRKTDNPVKLSTDIVFTCPEWLVEEKQMWGLVP